MKTNDIIKISMFAAITAILAWIPPIPLPFSPVPITLQVFGVLLSGAILGKINGAFAMIVYTLLGALGVPVFAGGNAGLSILVGPTGGYIIGFTIAAFLIGWILERFPQKSNKHYALAMTIAIVAIYLPGTIQLSLVTGMSFTKAFAVGSLPYIPLDIIKAIVAIAVARPIVNQLK